MIIRDLTLPNCLLFDKQTIKLSDYAKKDDRYATRYVQQAPVRWLPGDIITGVSRLRTRADIGSFVRRTRIGRFKRRRSCSARFCSNCSILACTFPTMICRTTRCCNSFATCGRTPSRMGSNRRFFASPRTSRVQRCAMTGCTR